jgi:plasmid maintenance system antidote protein VapI
MICSRKTVPSIVNGRAGISPKTAIRLALAFDTSAEIWLGQQLQYTLWHAERNRRPSGLPAARTEFDCRGGRVPAAAFPAVR